MADIVKQILAKLIQLADQVTRAADEASSFKQDCLDIKSKTEKLAALLRQAARASNDLYQRPTKRIIEDTEQVLKKALSIVTKCRANGLVKRVFTIIPAAAFRKMNILLENSIGDMSWLLRVEYFGLPPIAANEPILCLIWEHIAILYTGLADERSDAAASLVSLARDNDRYGKLIIEEGGVGPLLKLLKKGKLEGQENAAKAIGLLGRDPESVEHMVHAGVCSVFAKILKEGPLKVQSVVAWAVAELSSHYPKCQDLFQQQNIVRITESRALLCFAVLLEKGTQDVKYYSSMAIMEITAVAERDSDLRRSAFKPNTTACKAVVDQLLRIIEKGDSDLLIPCINAIGNLARTFRATETRMISPLVKLLDVPEPGISKEAAITLTKFASSDNYLHMDHSKAIISAGGAKHLIQLVYFGEQKVQGPALVLLCYIALHVPDSEALAQAEVLTVLEWASKHAYLSQHEKVKKLLQEVNSRLELYQSRGSRGFH
ncbi:hypothetical protein RND71_014159 [Anisodus tanguticus]|uniref:DUF7792 domain-containing protein n=1 Tax=Anisodus tanguticus TaxID=243964 RepID=A0AAE1VMH4_9SOLA|nr:hypothetical protein RND71_014159 [Anisodus tanguticus]